MTRRLVAIGLSAAAVLALAKVHAEPLDAATCGQIKGEQARLEQGGTRGNMLKGPEWAKANLAADKLDQIRRLIELDEQVLFRCSGRTLVELPAEVDADPPPTAPSEDGKDAASSKTDATPAAQKKPPAAKGAPAAPAKAPAQAAVKSPAVKAKPEDTAKTKAPANAAAAKKQGKAAPAGEGGATPPPEKAAAAKPKAKPQPPPQGKPKAKADDAYKAPPASPSVDPFANQPARQ